MFNVLVFLHFCKKDSHRYNLGKAEMSSFIDMIFILGKIILGKRVVLHCLWECDNFVFKILMRKTVKPQSK